MDVFEQSGAKDDSENLLEVLDALAKKYDDPVNVDRIEQAMQKCEFIKHEMRQVRFAENFTIYPTFSM